MLSGRCPTLTPPILHLVPPSEELPRLLRTADSEYTNNNTYVYNSLHSYADTLRDQLYLKTPKVCISYRLYISILTRTFFIDFSLVYHMEQNKNERVGKNFQTR